MKHIANKPGAPVVVALSSYVGRGAVGLRLVTPVLEAQGIEVWPLPTIVLANRPGLGEGAAVRIAARALNEALAALSTDDGRPGIDAVLTGYFADAAQVEGVGRFLSALKVCRPDTIILCDPVLGDEAPGLYIDASVARAIRDVLVPLADIITPNRFELAWLSGKAVQARHEILAAATTLAPAEVIVTSAVTSRDGLENILVRNDGAGAPAPANQGDHEQHTVVAARQFHSMPNGTGDAFSALYLGARLKGRSSSQALVFATRAMEDISAHSSGCTSLNIQSVYIRSGGFTPD